MLIQVYVKNEPVQKCDLLIAREDAVVSIPVSELKSLQENNMDIRLVKSAENMAMKAAVCISNAIASAEAVSSPVYISCTDKSILDGICSMEYTGPAGGVIKCAPSGTKPQSQPKVRNRAKPKAGDQAGKPEKPDGSEKDNAAAAETMPDVNNTQAAPADPVNAEAPAETPAPEHKSDGMAEAMADPDLVTGNDINTEPDETEPEKPDPTLDNTKKIMTTLKQLGVPSGQIPGVLEALREAMDAQITLPMQIKLKLAKDGATGDMDPEETARLVAPAFEELKNYLREIDDHNAGRS